jgi:hypothetical protein
LAQPTIFLFSVFTSEDDGPIVGILWCGEAASKIINGKIKAANHRVVFGDEPRYTIWYEAIHKSQLASTIEAIVRKKRNQPSEKKGPATPTPAEPEAPIDYDQEISFNVKTLTGRMIPIRARLGDTGHRLKEFIHWKEGIPYSEKQSVFNLLKLHLLLRQLHSTQKPRNVRRKDMTDRTDTKSVRLLALVHHKTMEIHVRCEIFPVEVGMCRKVEVGEEMALDGREGHLETQVFHPLHNLAVIFCISRLSSLPTAFLNLG